MGYGSPRRKGPDESLGVCVPGSVETSVFGVQLYRTRTREVSKTPPGTCRRRSRTTESTESAYRCVRSETGQKYRPRARHVESRGRRKRIC